jgi:hypothetical protein
VGVYLKLPDQSDAEAREQRAKIEAEMKRSGIRNYRDWPDIYVIVSIKSNFRMHYMGWPKAGDPREMAAREIIQKLSVVCDIPELAARVKEDHHSEPDPYLFNV